jgi:galactose mutarotase-like enzyme
MVRGGVCRSCNFFYPAGLKWLAKLLNEGYDHNWVLSKEDHELSLAASVLESQSGITMQVYTTEPGI